MTNNPAEPARFARLTSDNSCRFALGGRVIDVPHRPTVKWLAALSEQQLYLIVPGMLREDDARFVHQVLADPDCAFDVAQSRRIYEAVVNDVCGVPWWVAVKLASAAAHNWFILDPVSLSKGIDLLTLPIRRTLSVVYLLAIDSCKDEDERIIFENDMFRPPEGHQPAWTPVQQASSFAAFRAMNAAVQAAAGQPIVAAAPKPSAKQQPGGVGG